MALMRGEIQFSIHNTGYDRFPLIEEVFDKLASEYQSLEWVYGNVCMIRKQMSRLGGGISAPGVEVASQEVGGDLRWLTPPRIGSVVGRC
jgi:hypothetical protein